MIIETLEQYPQVILIEFVQDKCDLLDKFKKGDGVEVSINIRGREWTNPQGEVKYFNSIQGWRIESAQAGAGAPDMPPMPPMETFTPADNLNTEDNDDLPF